MSYPNGRIPGYELTKIPGGRLRSGTVARSWLAMHHYLKTKKGIDLRPTGPNSSYRDYATQVRFWNDYQAGRGPMAERGDVASVIYKGYTPDGKVFDSNQGGEPIEVMVGAGKVIRGWDEMLQLMQAGGRYTIYLPSILAYGDAGFEPDIKPDAVLIFDMEIKSLRKQ